ncbi:hypothetical protein [Reichenbachiella ulvae]|uniref:Uncharacterized protein n=1 Tax=Reichenbachiella ulvae TaxID=2980104 RepID=A0ABT3CQM1_9BACT|nr:hypothetical protein [Reichenbachiella ulvae]MCV9385779.1 hypothetical protein [Reichenbachiella ulvae]
MKIAKDILIFILALNTLASTLAVPLIYMDFGMRRDYIAEVLCINRDKPMLNCDGKCYLAKKLKAAQEQQDKENESINIKSAPSFFAQLLEMISFDRSVNTSSPIYQDRVLHFVLSTFLSEVFVPPRA